MNRKLNTEEIKRVSIEEFQQQDKIPVVLIVENIRSMHNIGSIFRTADAFSIEKIYLCGITATPPNNEIHKSALGAEFSVEWEHCTTATEAISALLTDGYTVLAVEQTDKSIMLDKLEISKSKKYALVFGNEVFGVEQETINRCENSVEIPQNGTKHSLNVSVACGVVLWKFFEVLR